MDCVNLLLITSTYLLYFWNKNVLATTNGETTQTNGGGHAAGGASGAGVSGSTGVSTAVSTAVSTPASTPAATTTVTSTTGTNASTPAAPVPAAGSGLTLELGKGKVASGNTVVTVPATSEVVEGYDVYVYEKGGSGGDANFNVEHVLLNGVELKVNNQPVKVSCTTKVTVYWKGNVPVLLCFSKPNITDTIRYTYYQFSDGNQWKEVANKASYNSNSDGKLDPTETKKLLDDVCRGLGDKLERLNQPEEGVARTENLQGSNEEGDNYSAIGISILSLLAMVVSV